MTSRVCAPSCGVRFDTDADALYLASGMGQYIQIGICTKLIIEQAGIVRAKTSMDEVAAAISEQSIDLSLYAKKEDTETVTWELPEAMLDDGLVDFLRDQFLLTRTSLADEQATLLAKLTDAGTWERMLGVIEEDGGWVLHRGRFKERFTVGQWRFGISVWLDLIVYLVEGKALLECYDNLFRYMEKTIARQRPRYPLAAAVKVCIG